MAKKLITERDVLEKIKSGATIIHVDADTLLTPSAKDAAFRHHIQVTLGQGTSGMNPRGVGTVVYIPPKDGTSASATKVIALGSDHGGYRLKEILKQYLGEAGFSVADVGTTSEEPCDYPDFAYGVASMVATGHAYRGIMIDGVGVASAIVANKVPGIRAVPCYDEFVARSSREHNDANLLTLGGRVTGSEVAKAIVKVWLDTPFSGGRHQGRVQKISDVEQRFTQQK